MADPAARAVPQPAGRYRHRAGLWPGISGRHRSRSAAGVLACRHRLPPCRQSYLRRLSAGAALFHRDVLGAVFAGPRHRRRPTGGGRGVADADRHGVQFSRRRVRAAGAGASAMGAAAAAFMAGHRPGPPQCLVRAVDRSRPAAADHLRRDRAAAAGHRLCAGDRARPARADVVRCAVRAVGDRRAGAALPDLADPRRHPRDAAVARGRGLERAGGSLGRAAGVPAGGDVRHRAAGHPQFRPLHAQSGRGADHLPAAGRSAGAAFRLFLRAGAGPCRKPDRRAVQSRWRGRRRRHRAHDVGAGGDRREPAIWSICGVSGCCARSGRP